MMTPTTEQTEVITHGDGHALVCAVPGSGKTQTLLERLAYRVASGDDAASMLVIMFNRSAAEGFRDRLVRRLGTSSTLPEVKTFHALGLAALNEWANRGLIERYTLAQEWELPARAGQLANVLYHKLPLALRRGVVEPIALRDTALALLDIDTPELKVGLDQVIGAARSRPIAAEKLTAFLALEIRRQLVAWLDEAHKLTFRRMLTLPVDLVADGLPLPCCMKAVRHVLVDEYQDINGDQSNLLDLMVANGATVLAVGDMDQCIYEWRGAQPAFMAEDNFESRYSGAARYSLTYTFRYGAALCNTANRLIDHNRDRLPLMSRPFNPISTNVTSVTGPAQAIALLRSWWDAGQQNQSAVLFRNWADSIPLQMGLVSCGVPFRISTESRNLFSLPAVRSLIVWLELTGMGRPLSPAMVAGLLAFPALKLKKALLTELADRLFQLGALTGEILARVPDYAVDRLQARWQQVQVFAGLDSNVEATEWLELHDRAVGWKDAVKESVPGLEKRENLLGMHSALQAACRLRRLKAKDLLRELVQLADSHNGNEGFVISSIHAAKGLEWDNVMLGGLEGSRFPLRGPDGVCRNEEEERRLFYVGMTRARQKLVCVKPEVGEVSAFLHEAGLMDERGTASGGTSKLRVRLKASVA